MHWVLKVDCADLCALMAVLNLGGTRKPLGKGRRLRLKIPLPVLRPAQLGVTTREQYQPFLKLPRLRMVNLWISGAQKL